jgi:GDPmannose 4,6-dehydratase
MIYLPAMEFCLITNHQEAGETFVTRKITRAASRIAAGLQSNLSLGNLDAKRDWGFAPEYCEGMWRILQHKKAEDFVLATGQTNTVKEFVELSFKHLGVELDWKGKGVNEKGVINKVDFEKAKSLNRLTTKTLSFTSLISHQNLKGNHSSNCKSKLLSPNRS